MIYNGTYEYNEAHCSWIVKQVTVNENTYYTLQNVGTNQYVVWDSYENATGKAVHLETREAPTQSSDKCFFTFYTSDGGTTYYIHPDQCNNNTRGLNYKGDFNNGVDKLRQRDSNGRGLIQFYNNTKNYIVSANLLTAPTIDVDEYTNTFTITDANSLPEGYTIRYTTDGNDPTATTGNVYSGPVPVTDNWTVKAVVVRYGLVLTEMATKAVEPAVVAPTVTNNYDGTISLSTPTPNADMYYTLDGSTPSNSTTHYTSAFSLDNATVVKAITLFGSVYSDVTTYNVPEYTAPTITFDNVTSLVTITSSGTAYYTTDGSTPTTSSMEYSAPFPVTSPTTVKAIATHAGYLTSEVTTLAIAQVTTPTIQNNGSNAISITTATGGATIYYTTDSTDPTTSSTEYTGPLTENVSNVTIKAIAVKEGMITSAVGSGSVTLQCATPVITRVGMTFTLSCNFPTDATLYYSLDGTTPTIAYSGPVSFTTDELPMTVTAVAKHSDYTDSESATFELINGSGTPSDPYLIYGDTDFANFVDDVNAGTTASACYKLETDVSASGIAAITTTFTGSFDGNYHTITNLGNPLFSTIDGGIVKNVMLKEVNISQAGDVGAIVCDAKGYTRIYNCGILPTDAAFSDGNHSSVASSGSGSAGGIVGKLEDDSRVVNCFSYADVSSTGYAAGIVGNNTFASDASVTDGKYANLRTMVVNCMFYGDITGGSTVWPVYGGTKITNVGSNAINNYNFYSDSCHFSTPLETSHNYYCSWPAKYDYLTRYEFHRYLLNSNRELCGWWVGASSAPSTMANTDVQAVPKDASLMAKWVLDRSVAPYPILKAFGTYSSPINIDADASWRETANKWEGKKLGTLSVTINPGAHAATGITSTTKNIVITDMDTLHGDYCYRKIQLPYYNAVFGNPEGATWDAKYGGNYKDYVVTGWDIVASGGNGATFVENWETGYNFADRDCTTKDEHRTFAQGGFYYVPNNVTSITITAHWGNAIYLGNGDNYYDRVDFKHDNNKPGTAFAPAGTRPTTLDNEKDIYTDKIATVAENLLSDGTVFDNAIVLVSNHQYCTGGEDVAPSRSFTIMSADFDLDNEPDYCLEWQLGVGTTRQSICPIRFDFLPVEEIGLCLKKDGSTQYYSLGCYRPKGHFEVTETALIRFGQFEFSNVRTVECPIILNGGIFEQYTKGTIGSANANNDKITYVIIGGNVMMPSFTPGAHVNSSYNKSTRHCAVNAIGGKFDYLYLTGNYNEGVTPNADNPHCYIDGGWFGQIAAAGKEGIGNASASDPKGNVTFKINHARIKEFYGGSTLADKRITGSIDVTIDSSMVTKYCGGPKFGDMYDGKTVTTTATGTIFKNYYGGGNGGTSYVQYKNTDGEKTVSSYNWYNDGSNGGSLNSGSYVAGRYRDDDSDKAPNTYEADYDMEIVNVSTGTNSNNAVFRTYFHAAQFSATNTGTITNELTGCKVLENFYGGGFLGGVNGDVTSTLTNTEVHGSAFGAGYSASVPTVDIYELGTPPTGKTPPTIDVYTGIITPQSGGTKTTYTWTNETSIDGHTLSTATPTFEGCEYFYTNIPLINLGTVSGNATLTIKGNSTIGTSNDSNTGHVYGGGDQSAVTGNCSVILRGNTHVLGSVFGGGNRGAVGGNSSVTIQDEP